jgi:hypothetical protein
VRKRSKRAKKEENGHKKTRERERERERENIRKDKINYFQMQ